MADIYEDTIDLDKLSVEAYNYNIGDKLKIFYAPNDKDVLVPSHTTNVKRKEVPGRSITITVADNGFIVKGNKQVKLAQERYNLNDVVLELTTEEVIIKKDFDPEQWEEVNFDSLSLKLNTHYKAQQKRALK